MSKKTAGLVFLAICVALAGLLIVEAISPIISGSVFALALVSLGILSRGFTRK
jgi:hypothetical protein